ncbi:MAG TPA: proline--tRNA ligase [Abditibacteriaceae bacterium]|jgi:prolyl-tRNA synthetase
MRQSQFFAPTLRQVKADNEGHALLLRGGFIRQLTAGIYSYLPLGWRVLRRVEQIVREEMDAADGVELLMPALHPTELWAETGRDRLDILFKLNDRKGSEYLLGPTHEEVVCDLVRNAVSSYKQLPQMLYQIQTKFRDEERPRAGLLRGREFVMKDLYSFDRDLAGLDVSFDKMVEAYKRIFTRCGIDYKIVDAAGGGIGGFDTKEFMVMSAAGEDEILFNDADGYAANVEMATSVLPPLPDRDDIGDEIEEFATPGIVTIEALENFAGGAKAEHQIKTLVYFADAKPVLALLRGDHQLNEVKLASALGAANVRAAREEEIVELLGARPGSLGAVRVLDKTVVADEALRGRKRMTTGANKDGFHLRGVDVERDIPVTQWADLRTAQAGEHSPNGGALQISRSIELGHVFKLGNKYTKAMGAKFLDENGKEQIIEMGCYGIGVSRIVAAIAEIHHDERGVVWPREVAPFQAHLLLLDKDAELTAIAELLYNDLRAAGVDVLFDDRNERPGSKFADADLFGIPTQIMVGKTTRESGQVELRKRADKSSTQLPVDAVLSHIMAAS